MNKLTTLFLLTTIIYSCSNTTRTEQEDSKKKIVVTADSCKRWGLTPVNFEIEYPETFESELNASGGFYLQLRKVNGDTILQEISFSRIDGDMDEEKFKRNLVYIDSVMKVSLVNAGQNYNTDFIGTGDFAGKATSQIRSTISLKNVPRDKFVANGDYSSLITCVYSPTQPGQAIMVSIISTTKEDIDPKTKLGVTTSEILNSFKFQ